LAPTPPDEGEQLATEPAYAGRLLRVDRDTVRLPNGTRLDLEIVRHPGAAAVVPLLSGTDAEDPHVLLLRQYRYAAGGTIWEIPAGVLEPGEEPVACARRELREETGAEADSIEYLTTILTTPGFTDERIHLFVATGIRGGSAAPNADELIEVRPEPLSQTMRMIRDGEIADAKTIIALLYVAGFRMLL
jgi:ADP-ribose pyrophosphatase